MIPHLLLSILVRGAALSVVTLAGVVALRRASAAHRHLAWTAGAVALLVLPLAAWTLPGLDVAVLPAQTPAARAPAPARVAAPAADAPIRAAATDTAPSLVPDEPRVDALVAARPVVASSPPPATTPSPFVLTWIAGAVVVALRLAFGATAAHRLVARSDAVADARVLDIAGDAARRLDLPAPPSLRTTGDVDAPLTIGALRPHVLLPVGALAWPADELRLALLHEFAHVRRRDLLAELAARLAVVVHWPNPLAWLAASRLRIERERASDDLVLAAGNGADEYASFLVSLARALRRTSPPGAVAATMAGGPQFERRVRAILDGGQRRRSPSWRTRALVALFAASSLSFAACVRPTAPTSESTEHEIAAAPPAEAPTSPPRHEGVTRGPGVFVSNAITVELDGSGQSTSISAALAAAPDGAVIRVGPGTFDEHVEVTKAVTIEGAGADRTTIASDAPRATLHVAGARGVVIVGVTLTQRGEHPEGAAGPGVVVDLSDCGARIESCAIVGGPGSGVVVGQGADVTIDGCLVAAVWNTGVAVGAAGERPPTVRVANCDIRNCWQRGVTIAPGNRDVTIERCRISGSSWHGIRYDSAVPTIRGNLIFQNVRSGIYASGDTAGLIEGNVFFRNGMSDVSCWYEARDTIEGNSFVESQREAVAILGASAPSVRKNVFFGCKVALLRGEIAGNSPAERALVIAVRPVKEAPAGQAGASWYLDDGNWRFAIGSREWNADGTGVAPETGTLPDALKGEALKKMEQQPVPGSDPPRFRSAVAVSIRAPKDASRDVAQRVTAWCTGAGVHKIEFMWIEPKGGAIEGNVLWRIGTSMQAPPPDGKGMVDAVLPPGNVAADPGFVDAEHRNYALSQTSAARAAGAGVASPLAFASPWPLRPEETATAPKETPQPAAAPVRESAAPKAAAGAATDLAGAKADVLQINDPAQRERGLAAIGAAIASADPNVARPALASLYELRDVKYDKRRFRADVVRQLGSADAGVQTAAAYALMQVEREPGDVDLVLAAAEAKPVAPGGLLHVAMMLSKSRVDGRLADLFVKALAVDDPRRGAMDTANYLRGMWVAPAVEDAVVAAWRRYEAAGHERLLWPYILGQMQPAPREPRVRAIFEMMAGGDDGVRQLAGGVVTKPVDESARALAAQLAAAGLATAPTSSLRRTYLDAIRANGGREQVAGLRALAGNEMVGDDLRSLAGTIADELERR